jgi:Methylamine utilisation protein MauE
MARTMFDAAFSFDFAQHFLLDGLVIVFLVSAIAKLLALHTFRFGLQLLPFMAAPLAAVASVAVPVAELLLAVFLFLNHGWAKYAAISMLIVFSGVALVAIGLGRQVPCGCFGQLDGQSLSWRTVLRNGLLILVVVSVLGFEARTEWLLLSLWPTGLLTLAGLSMMRIYRNQQRIVGLRKVNIL